MGSSTDVTFHSDNIFGWIFFLFAPPTGILSFFSVIFSAEQKREEGKNENSSRHRDCEYTHDRLCMWYGFKDESVV